MSLRATSHTLSGHHVNKHKMYANNSLERNCNSSHNYIAYIQQSAIKSCHVESALLLSSQHHYVKHQS